MKSSSFFAGALALCSVVLALPTREAHADMLTPSGNSSGAITGIGKGVKELGIETNFGVAYDKIGDSSALRVGGIVGPTFRYFLVDNLSLGVNASFLYRRAQSTGVDGTLGGLGTIGVDYHASLGGGMFFYPGLSVGGFYGKREIRPDAKDLTKFTKSSTYGGAARIGMGLAFYPSRSFSLFARPEALVLIGKNGGVEVSTTGSSVPGKDGFYASVDASFAVGMSYVF